MKGETATAARFPRPAQSCQTSNWAGSDRPRHRKKVRLLLPSSSIHRDALCCLHCENLNWISNATSISPRWSHSRGPNTSAIPRIHTFCNQFDVGQDSTGDTDGHGRERSDRGFLALCQCCCLSSSALQESQTLGDDQNATHRPGQSRACASRTTAGGINTNRNERERRPTMTKTIHEKKQWKTLIHRSSQTPPQAKMNGASTPRTIPATPSPHRAYCPLLRFRPQSSYAAGTDCSLFSRASRTQPRQTISLLFPE
ncbi:hypothetical protein GQ607_015506 [Colletotrichum asianum]|uniref:Uncharacterized protein n=1 Tax=Colletotrichum asianum TaxID=702518 RepID=A0A8H3ZMS1_9PEZI|nr:hypothetical protein GQ607_015506 [Colletotrichum asianum]